MKSKREKIPFRLKMLALVRIISFAGPYRWALGGALVLAAGFSASSHMIPLFVGRAVESAAGQGSVDFAGVAKALSVIPVLIVCSVISDLLMRLISVKCGAVIIRNIRRRAFDKISSLPLSYLDSHGGGEMLSVIITDADRLSDGLVTGLCGLYSSLFGIVVTLIMMLTISPAVALMVVALTPLSMLVAAFVSGRTFSLFGKSAALLADETAVIEETVNGSLEIRAFGNERLETQKFNEINARYRKTAGRAVFFSSITNPLTRFVNSVVYCGVTLAGGLLTLSGRLGIASFVSLLSYSRDYAKPFNDMSGIIAEAQNSLASAMRLFNLIDAIDEPEDPSNAEAITESDSRGVIRAENVSFSYTDAPFMENLSFEALPGQRIAIVGPTGCGKTTLVNLIMRFYPLSGGRITFSGKDISSVDKRSLRSSVGMVLQDTWLSSGTVKENIAMGRPGATDDEIVSAAVRSRADAFIRRLPQGYDTPLGDAGDLLSAGERQLLCISRVMLALPPVLILDEATSSIDTRTEIKISEAFAGMMKGRTSFIVAHRLNTVKNADLILVMKEGKIIESGTHDELMSSGGFYSDLYGAQFGQLSD